MCVCVCVCVCVLVCIKYTLNQRKLVNIGFLRIRSLDQVLGKLTATNFR